MAQLLDYLKQAVEDNASGLFIVAGSPVCEKRDTQLIPIRAETLLPQAAEVLITELYTQAGRPMEHYLRNGDGDFSFSVEGLARFRVNTYRQRGSMA